MKLTDKVRANVRAMPANRAMGLLRVACVLAIIALTMMTWSLVDPTPAPVLLALSLGQILGTLSFASFLAVIAWDRYQTWRAASQAAIDASRKHDDERGPPSIDDGDDDGDD